MTFAVGRRPIRGRRAGLENASSIGAAGEDDDVIIGKGENMSMSCDRAALFIPSDLMAF